MTYSMKEDSSGLDKWYIINGRPPHISTGVALEGSRV